MLGVSLVCTFFVFYVSMLLKLIIRKMAMFERYPTKSAMYEGIMFKLFVSLVINMDWYYTVGIPLLMLMVTGTVSTIVSAHLFTIWKKLKIIILRKHVVVQANLNKLYVGNTFNFHFRSA